MNGKEAQSVLALARASSQSARAQALRGLRYNAQRVDDQFLKELDALAAEAQTLSQAPRTLEWGRHHRPEDEPGVRQILKPSQRKPGVISDLEPLADPLGFEHLLPAVEEWCMAWKRAEQLVQAGACLPGALLLHGEPGTGKTHLTSAIARRLEPEIPAGVIDAHNIVTSYLGQTGASLAKAFEACASPPALLVIEEVDAFGLIRGSGDSSAGAENSRVTIALMRLLDQQAAPVIMTTNRIELLDPALVRRCELVLETPEPGPELLVRIAASHLAVEPDQLARVVLKGRNVRQVVPVANLHELEPVPEFERLLGELSA